MIPKEEPRTEEEAEDSVGCTFRLADFEGPLDTLLFLVGKSKLSIEEVRLADITEQYLQYLEELDGVDLDRASEFIVMAAKLVEIKSKALLPKIQTDAPEEPDEEGEIKQRLQEYKLYKEASEKMKGLETVGIHYREPDPSVGRPRLKLKDMTPDGLTDALKKLFLRLEERAEEIKERHIVRDRFTVEERIAVIKDTLLSRRDISFFSLFDVDYSRSEIITTFQALLELIKLQFVSAVQRETFGDIYLHREEEVGDGHRTA